MTQAVISEARAAQLANENPQLRCRRSIVNRHYAELALETLGEDYPWCSSRPTVLAELGRTATDDPAAARRVAAELEAHPPRTAHAAVLRVRHQRNGAPTPSTNQLAAELVVYALDFRGRYPATSAAEIVSALDTAHRGAVQLKANGKLKL